MGDTHIGGHHTDHKAIERDIGGALERDDRINVVGDVFDLILPQDRKRFKVSALTERLRETDAILNETVEMGVEMFKNAAPNIDMIGIGNHETAVEKHHSFDPVRELIRRLNADHGGTIQYGDYMGYIDYRLSADTGRNSRYRVVIFYFHGAGGGAMVTKGMIPFNRLSTWVDADVIWMGHQHNKILDATPQRMYCPLEGDAPKLKPFRCVMSGSYMDTLKGPRSYAMEKGMAPQAKGGVRLEIRLREGGGIGDILTTM
jgi:hypothetical protein